jgi:hypothetical protein
VDGVKTNRLGPDILILEVPDRFLVASRRMQFKDGLFRFQFGPRRSSVVNIKNCPL